MLSQKKVKNDGYDDGDQIICSENFLANVHSLSQWFDNKKKLLLLSSWLVLTQHEVHTLYVLRYRFSFKLFSLSFLQVIKEHF